MESENLILRKIKQQLETVRGDFAVARQELDSTVEHFVADIESNLKNYVLENVRREARKSPESAELLSQEQFDALRRELNEAMGPEMDRIVRELRESATWRDDGTVFIDLNSKIWKTVKSVEEPANAVLGKFDLNPINMKSWAWLSPEMDALITTRFPAVKKEYVDKRKNLKYLENRYIEETRLGNVLNKLESL